MKGGDILSSFKDLNTLGICTDNSSMFLNMLKTLKDQCEEDNENELLEQVIPAIDHLNAIKNFFIDRRNEVLKSMGGRVIPVRVIGATNLRLIVDNTRKEK
jgi:hypothetical protein